MLICKDCDVLLHPPSDKARHNHQRLSINAHVGDEYHDVIPLVSTSANVEEVEQYSVKYNEVKERLNSEGAHRLKRARVGHANTEGREDFAGVSQFPLRSSEKEMRSTAAASASRQQEEEEESLEMMPRLPKKYTAYFNEMELSTEEMDGFNILPLESAAPLPEVEARHLEGAGSTTKDDRDEDFDKFFDVFTAFNDFADVDEGLERIIDNMSIFNEPDRTNNVELCFPIDTKDMKFRVGSRKRSDSQDCMVPDAPSISAGYQQAIIQSRDASPGLNESDIYLHCHLRRRQQEPARQMSQPQQQQAGRETPALANETEQRGMGNVESAEDGPLTARGMMIAPAAVMTVPRQVGEGTAQLPGHKKRLRTVHPPEVDFPMNLPGRQGNVVECSGPPLRPSLPPVGSIGGNNHRPLFASERGHGPAMKGAFTNPMPNFHAMPPGVPQPHHPFVNSVPSQLMTQLIQHRQQIDSMMQQQMHFQQQQQQQHVNIRPHFMASLSQNSPSFGMQQQLEPSPLEDRQATGRRR